MKNVRLIIISVIMIIFIAGVNCFCETQAEMREKNRIIAEYYRQAMEAYYRGEYTVAISNWVEVLKVDPRQTKAEKLIENARLKMTEKIKPLRQEIDGLLADGEYKKAQVKIKELLALDPSNQKLLKRSSKIEKITQSVLSANQKGRVAGLVRKSVWAYISDDENPKLSVNAIRYAFQLNPNYQGLKSLKAHIEQEYKSIAQSERLIDGMDLVEQKLQTALSNIYDGKYDRTILECNEILELEPRNILALKRLGSAYYASGKKKQAKEAWVRASKIDPKDKELKKFIKLK